MDYYIIHKVENNNGELKHTPVGYSIDQIFVEEINNNYSLTLGAWIEENKNDLENGVITATDYFTVNNSLFLAKTTSNNIEGLTELNDLNGL